MILTTDEYTLTISNGSLTLNSDNFEAHFNSGRHKRLSIKPKESSMFELMIAIDINNSLVLYHLDVPPNFQGIGFGRLGISFFYLLLTEYNYTKYAIKFGGGVTSEKFLLKLGFKQKHIHTSQNSDFEGESVMVGEFESTGEKRSDWRLDPLPIDTFPTSFFSLE